MKNERKKPMKKKRVHSRDFKISALRGIENGETIASISRKYQIHERLITKWREKYQASPENAFKDNNEKIEVEKFKQLEQTIGQLYLENTFLKKTLQQLEKRLQQYRSRENLHLCIS